MSQENVDFVLGAYARFNAGERVPELWFWHPDAEFQAAREDPDSATHTGIAAIRKQWARWLDAYPIFGSSRWTPRQRVTECSSGSASSPTEQQAGLPSRWSWRTSTPSGTAGPLAALSTSTVLRPSKRRGCGSDAVSAIGVVRSLPTIDETVEAARLAERAGLESVWTTEFPDHSATV